MPPIHIEVNHKLIEKEAVGRIKGLLEKLKAEYGESITDLKESWQENRSTFSFKAMGMLIEGSLTVENSKLILDGKIPFAVLPFKGKITNTLIEEANKLLA
jgi:hypothetical protein